MTNPIVDNRDRKVMDFLSERVVAGSDLSIVSAYFTIHAYKSLRDALDGVARARFLYGDPQGIGTMDPAEGEARSFRLNEDRRHGISSMPWRKSPSRGPARSGSREQVDVRTVSRAGFLHGKLYHICERATATARPWSGAPTSPGAGSASARRRTSNSTSRSATRRTASGSSAGSTNCGPTRP